MGLLGLIPYHEFDIQNTSASIHYAASTLYYAVDGFIFSCPLRLNDPFHPSRLSTKTRGALANHKVLPLDRLFDKLLCDN